MRSVGGLTRLTCISVVYERSRAASAVSLRREEKTAGGHAAPRKMERRGERGCKREGETRVERRNDREPVFREARRVSTAEWGCIYG